MMTSPTSPSTRKLSDVARHVIYPDDIVSSGFPAVRNLAAKMGITLDTWQEGIGTLALGKRADGKYACTIGGVVMSIPRQVGKTFLVAVIVICLCVLNPGLTVVWTAHRNRTNTKTFQTVKALAQRKRIKKYLRAVNPIRNANGEQEIRFSNGSCIMFGAREFGFGRGFDKVDIEVFDEAQILTEKALEDMVAATNASTQPTGALLFFMGTPPRPIDDGEQFASRRQKALAGGWNTGVYVEISADDDADPNDVESWAPVANPSYPSRTPLESIQRMREQLTDDESFMREAMGIWSVKTVRDVICNETWGEIADAQSLAVNRLALAVDVSPDQTVTSIGLAGQRSDSTWHVELWHHQVGTAWVPAFIAGVIKRNPGAIRAIVIDGASPAATLLNDLQGLGIEVMTTSAHDMATACMTFYRDVFEKKVHHTGQPQLTAALTGASKRSMLNGNAWGWSRKSSASDITPLVAVTLALWGAQHVKVKAPRKRRGSGKVVAV